ncbi:MAG TPA: DUF2157 domain-containing protein [Candidatus Acidoferrum sp.]|nr:DUF2157 domain-containing protein [Candidatus Acidoferrum sp.]
MAQSVEKNLEQWVTAGILDATTAERIREFEQTRRSSEGLRWPVLLALALGGALLCAGVLLFVAAHWDELSPASRFSLVLLLVAAFPVAGAAIAERFPALSVTFYAIGTVCVGAGIFRTAQIFNLEEHWPSGILLWAIGAIAGWLLLRQWPQAALLALLAPAWLAGEWEVRAEMYAATSRVILEGLLLLSICYLTSKSNEEDSVVRRVLMWIGGIALLPLGILAFMEGHEIFWSWRNRPQAPFLEQMIAWSIAIGLPLSVAFVLRKRAAWTNALAAVWVLVIGTFRSPSQYSDPALPLYAWLSLGPYFWAGVGSIGLVAWGLLERRKERINLGVAGFALVMCSFYFSNVMDKLGRSASLIGLGVLFLFGGWGLERARRQLVARVAGGAQ